MAGPDASAGSEPFGPPPSQDGTDTVGQGRSWPLRSRADTDAGAFPSVCVAKSRIGMPGSRNYECATSLPSSDSAAALAGRPARDDAKWLASTSDSPACMRRPRPMHSTGIARGTDRKIQRQAAVPAEQKIVFCGLVAFTVTDAMPHPWSRHFCV
ncbi:hypothetical protein MTO96_006633 [Rhipicephalus appendiculatus]